MVDFLFTNDFDFFRVTGGWHVVKRPAKRDTFRQTMWQN